jgi:hypothetical protein
VDLRTDPRDRLDPEVVAGYVLRDVRKHGEGGQDDCAVVLAPCVVGARAYTRGEGAPEQESDKY